MLKLREQIRLILREQDEETDTERSASTKKSKPTTGTEDAETTPDAQSNIEQVEPPEQDADADVEETGDPLFTVDTMIKLVNAIRSGQSLKDKEVIQKLNDWWDTNKKTSLKEFLKMLARITKIISEKPAEHEDISKTETAEAMPDQESEEEEQSVSGVASI